MTFSMGSFKQVSPASRASNPFCNNIRGSRQPTGGDALLEMRLHDSQESPRPIVTLVRAPLPMAHSDPGIGSIISKCMIRRG